MSDYKCPHCEYYIWEGKEIYECQLEQENLKLRSTLQEIKAIATRAFAVCDDDCGNANRFTEILDLITKVEEE